MKRRTFLTSPLGAALAARAQPKLRCSDTGEFKILVISDLHYRPDPDVHGIALTEQLIEAERPHLVLVTGDCLSGHDCPSPEAVRTAIANVAAAMEKKRVPWAIVFGNHDQEHFAKTRLDKHAVLEIYASHPHNLNAGYERGLTGGGNKYLLVWNAAGTRPVYCIWLLDSNEYFTEGKNTYYDWIRTDQVCWYYRSSVELEKRYGGKVPGLMFFHIPLREFNEMVNQTRIIGARHEPEAPSPVNSGLFAAVLERGDVRGIYCGHDHTNNYVGRWKGIELGYVGSAGHRAYPRVPPEDPSNGKVRGGRLLLIIEGPPARHKTWMRFKDGSVNWEFEYQAYAEYQLGK
ncbi:MAG: metallophosphoesterase family protein [Bryobacterales bacterium]|nr:metallophosphoesterase family protein [Bryobacteraceae bacterium]MDW8131497.1 metallophosphoesterase family protein [Bryobacterales bacterium]